MTMIERVARAIEDQMASDDNMPEDIARAAIEAMLWPTNGMVTSSQYIPHASDTEIYNAMIDAALRDA